MEKDRNIDEVIDAILAVEELPKEARDRLVALKDQSYYTSPEMQAGDWHVFQIILATEVGRPAEVAWKQRVQDIFNGRIPLPEKQDG